MFLHCAVKQGKWSPISSAKPNCWKAEILNLILKFLSSRQPLVLQMAIFKCIQNTRSHEWANFILPRVHSFLKQCCALSSVHSKQGTSADVSRDYYETFCESTLLWINWRSCNHCFKNDWSLVAETFFDYPLFIEVFFYHSGKLALVFSMKVFFRSSHSTYMIWAF